MAGHSQFKNIMHRKAAQDKKKAKVATKYIRDIVTAARTGGGDLNANPVLRSVVDKARKENMTKDVIDRAIKRGTGEIAGADYVERTYEGYATGGVAVMVTALTDNPTRTITSLRTIFSKHGGNVGADGSVAWMFKSVGSITYPNSVGTLDALTDAAILAGADDVEKIEDGFIIYTAATDFAAVRDELAKTLGEASESTLTYLPTQTQHVSNLETAQTIQKMLDALDNDDDVQLAIPNWDVADDIATQL